jgi:hypothetical protein
VRGARNQPGAELRISTRLLCLAIQAFASALVANVLTVVG